MIDHADLPNLWRARAETLRRYGAPHQAETLEACAGELEEMGYGDDDAILSLQEAAEWSGYSPSRLRALIRDQRLENVSENSRIKLRRGDLPRKPRRDRTPSEVT